MSGDDVHELAVALAPRVHLSDGEPFYPLDPGKFVAACDLAWMEKGRRSASVEIDDPRRLGGVQAEPLVHRGIPTSAFTRPGDASPLRRAGLPPSAGFALEPRDPAATVPGSRDLARVPAFYDYSAERATLTYWFFYGASGIPRFLDDLLSGGGPRVLAAEGALTEEHADRILELARRQYPALYLASTEATLADATSGEFAPADVESLGGGIRKLRNFLATLAKVILDRDRSLMHDGDWEGVRIYLSRTRTPEHVHFFQHHGGAGAAWDGRKRLDVFSAYASHASFPSRVNAMDTAAGDGETWETSRRLENVRDQPWYGFGGAWGRVHRSSDGTGPLGPSRWK